MPRRSPTEVTDPGGVDVNLNNEICRHIGRPSSSRLNRRARRTPCDRSTFGHGDDWTSSFASVASIFVPKGVQKTRSSLS